MPAILCTESKRSSQANSGVFLLLWYHGFAANTTLCRIEAVDWTWITACVPAFSISTTSIGTRLDLQCSRNHFLRWALLKWWSASLDLYPVPSSCKALVGEIRSWRTSFFVVFLSGWATDWAVFKTFCHTFYTRRLIRVPIMGEAELSDEQPPSPHRRDEVWRQCHLHEIFWWNHDTAKGGRARKTEKGDPKCMLWMNQTELGCCNVLKSPPPL